MECVLDVDSAGREPQKQAAKNYHHDQPRDPELFRFEPIPLSFEPVEPGRCAPVLYSSAVRDMIDYSLRSCVEHGVTVRRCKNCGRWFPQTGRVSAEYCERPVKYGEQRCREIGAFRQWTKSRPTTRFSRRTARSTKSASHGSKPGASPTSSFMRGASRPEKKRRKATARSSRWRNSSSGSATRKYKITRSVHPPTAYSLSIASLKLLCLAAQFFSHFIKTFSNTFRTQIVLFPLQIANEAFFVRIYDAGTRRILRKRSP